jgi:hypothetical protein
MKTQSKFDDALDVWRDRLAVFTAFSAIGLVILLALFLAGMIEI